MNVIEDSAIFVIRTLTLFERQRDERALEKTPRVYFQLVSLLNSLYIRRGVDFVVPSARTRKLCAQAQWFYSRILGDTTPRQALFEPVLPRPPRDDTTAQWVVAMRLNEEPKL